MANYKAYPEYKDSGDEWLGEFPNSWDVVRLKHIASIYGRIGFRGYTVDDIVGEGEGAIVLSPSNIVDEKFSLEKKTFLRWEKYFESPEIIVKENDVLLVKTGSTYGKSTIIKALGEPMTINPQMALIKKIVVEPRFLAYWFNTSVIKSKIEVANTGSGMPTMTQENINNFPVLIPPNKLDVLIADFLDHETAKIDNLIEKQQQLIGLLKEKRQAVISHAVTKGLNPDVPMKDSGVEWLGEVPEHWKLIKFSHCVSIRSGQVDPRKFPYCDYWLIAPNHIVGGEGRIINLETAKDQGADSGKYLCRTGEVIYSKIRPALVKACLSPSDTVLCSADMYPMTSCNGLTNNFLLLYLLSDVFTRFAVNQADRVAMPKINRESLSDCKIPVPPIDEQEKIYSHAREALEKLDVLLQKSQLTIEFFQERRTALISAAVTGKIDVRDWVAPDKQDVEEPQEATA
ncbi:restriction endonuclease subunit S [Huaxiibacter chinensis]|uniref:restriction endonuclease subunit S n=1 Tax=Huaxiibacter chinensis TaxID=2899785 RepID=UPI003D31424C